MEQEQQQFADEVLSLMDKLAVKDHPFIDYYAVRNYQIREAYKMMKKKFGQEESFRLLGEKYAISPGAVDKIVYRRKNLK